mmetsp:Transcript_18311/g.29271  ORF Transcript_18311/g.29271 Transcript_18311/m.29271 type:complete len:88 (-) Transcript_18311:6573-6836(-)
MGQPDRIGTINAELRHLQGGLSGGHHASVGLHSLNQLGLLTLRRCSRRNTKCSDCQRDVFHRSISPNTTSIVPIIAATSASWWPVLM